MKKYFLLSLVCSSALALEFGSLGSLSSSMGFAGVALKKNNFATYYNPALLPYSKNSFAFSTGVNFSQKNLLELTSVDENADARIKNSLNNITDTFKGNDYGNFAGVIDDFANRNINNANQDIQKLASDIKSPNLSTTKEELKLKMQNDTNLSNSIKNELLISIKNDNTNLSQNGSSVKLLENIITTANTSDILELLDASRQGQVNGNNELLNMIKDLKISDILDSKTNEDINTIYNAIYDNEVNASINSGLEYHMPYEKGAFAVGIHNKITANTFAGLNKEKSELIVKIKNNTEDIYLKIYKKDNQIYVSKTDFDEYSKKSAFSEGTKNDLIARTLILTEVPVSYGQIFDLEYGEISAGTSLKYINAMGYYINKGIEINLDGANSDDLKFKDDLKNPKKTNTIGIDAGVLYSYDNFSTGMVIKNINNPKIKFQNNHSIKLNPQVRIGASYEYQKATFAFDLDLLSNKTLSYKHPKSQSIGAGVKYDFTSWFNLRGGMAYDFKKNDGLILTTGFGLFDIFDLSFASGTKSSHYTKNEKTRSIPNYLDLKISFGYQW